MKMKNFKINSENITNIAARIVVAVGIIVLVVVAFKTRSISPDQNPVPFAGRCDSDTLRGN